jgi:tetratricopeptide (TPR) repeat protein
MRQFPEFTKITFTYGYCYESTGSQNAYQPFVEILETLTRAQAGQKNATKLMLALLKETAPDWLLVVPMVGPALSAGAKSASLVRQWLLDVHAEKQTSQSSAMTTQYINMLFKIVPPQSPLVLVIEDAHWIDDASCQLLQRLASRISEHPIVVFVTYRPDGLHPQHPLVKVQQEMRIKGSSRIIRLAGLNEAQIQTYITKRFHFSLHPKLAPWLAYLCKGNPLFVTQYLSLLERDKVIQLVNNRYVLNGDIRDLSGEWILTGKLADNPIPETVEVVLEERINRLLEEDRELLQIASVQGDYFMSSLLAELAIKRELDILSHLRRVVERHQIISFYAGVEWLKSKTEFYIFEHHLMQQALYRKLSPRERLLHHRRVAELLELIFKEQANPPRRLILEVAYHYSLGDEPFLAARYYFLAAQSSFFEGAFVEATELCMRTRECLHKVDNQDRMLVEVIQLLFIVSRYRWQAKPDQQGKLALAALAQEADEAALRTGDLVLLAQARYLKSMTALVSESLKRCIELMQEALKIAQQSGDQICEVEIMAELGHHMVGENLMQGLNLLYQAYSLYQRIIPFETVPDTKTHYRLLHYTEGLIGVGELDRGRYDEAEKWLKESVSGLKALGMHDDLPPMLNYLGQLYTGLGLFEEAEKMIKASIDLFKQEEDANPWRDYNLGLLGKLYMEWGRIEDAVEPVLKGWEETQATWNTDLVPLVRNYYAELLMHPKYKSRNFATAKQLLDTTLEETQLSGFHRSAIAALSLQSQLALMQDYTDMALAYSTQAVEYLERMGGTLPALRTEEVLFNQYLALKANKHDQEASGYLSEAYAVVLKKAESVNGADQRKAFLERVPVSKAIVTAFKDASTQELPDTNSPAESDKRFLKP